MGALLALELVARRQHRKGQLVALAAPVYIDGWSTPSYRWLRHVVYHLPGLPTRIKVEENEPFGIKNDLVRAIVKAKFERGDNFHYRWVPLTCIRQVDRLRRWVLDSAHRVPGQRAPRALPDAGRQRARGRADHAALVRFPARRGAAGAGCGAREQLSHDPVSYTHLTLPTILLV